MSKDKPTIRGLEEGDHGLLYHSWLTSYRRSNEDAAVRAMTSEDFHKAFHDMIERHIEDDFTKFQVMCNAADPDQVYGWICYQNDESATRLNFVYVKHTFRQLGFCNELLAAAGIDRMNPASFTHKTKASEAFLHPYCLGYNLISRKISKEISKRKAENEQQTATPVLSVSEGH